MKLGEYFRIPPRQGRLFFAWVLWAVAMMSNAVVGVLLQAYLTRVQIDTGMPLRDIGFEFLPYISSSSMGLAIPDLCSLLSATIITISLAIHFQPSMASVILRRVLLISAIAYAGRAVSVPLTLLPNPDPDCIPFLHPSSLFLSVVLVPFGGSITCADVFYSGHTIPISCALLVWIDYMRYSRLRFTGIFV